MVILKYRTFILLQAKEVRGHKLTDSSPRGTSVSCATLGKSQFLIPQAVKQAWTNLIPQAG